MSKTRRYEMRRLLAYRHSGHHWKPHRWVLSQGVWDRLRAEYAEAGMPEWPRAGMTLFDWPVEVTDAVPDDYIGVELPR